MNSYNLTEQQKQLLRDLVRFKREGLKEPISISFIYGGGCTIRFRDGEGPKPTGDVTGDFLALHEADLISYRLDERCTKKLYNIKQAGYDAVDNDFEVSLAHNRMPLGVLAKKVARWLNENDPIGESVPSSQVIQGLAIDQEQYERAMRELLDLDLAESVDEYATFGAGFASSPRLTKDGRLAVKRDFIMPDAPAVAQQIGVQINAPISQSPISGIVGSQDVTVNQAIESADLSQLAEIGAAYLDQVVDLIKNDLPGSQLIAYTSAVQELKDALADKQKDNDKLQRLTRVVAFLDSADGAIELGEKGWKLTAKVLPYLPILIGVIDRFVSSL